MTITEEKEDCMLESTTFLAKCDGFEVTLSSEHQAFEWFNLDGELPESLEKIKKEFTF